MRLLYRTLLILALGHSLTAADSLPTRQRAEQSIRVVAPVLPPALKLHLLPTFQTPVYVEFFLAAPPKVRVFRTSGKHPYYKGPVEIYFERELTPEHYVPTQAELEELALLPEVEPAEIAPMGRDGDTYLLEIRLPSGVKTVSRWEPTVETEKRGLKNFNDICDWLLKSCGVMPRKAPTR